MKQLNIVLRFWNHDVMHNINGVLVGILSTVSQHGSEPPHATPLPCGEREQR
jgi:very-short-patch-repair endonuclease